ncbi:hypothetical protein O6H91_08G111000 [Diphasiastrum complanatum]|uniref:Uncharacterized protein n=1 Tax=Diphasiastrum complanatum TaxID=34168 RepID=A0ACC2D143_DIPCM|nr:hypothetical protein O6H91_08G111000 [Diphasiastrum complanatum]
MGIQGLLKALRPYTESVQINKYSGRRVGIDAYSWLHKGGYACSREICEQLLPTTSADYLPLYVKYCMHRINMLKFNNVTPVVVFDGGYLPQKAATEIERRRKRQMNLEQARLKLTSGDPVGANELYQRAVEITPIMAHELIKVLEVEAVEFVVAPYEADAQLAFLANLSPEEGGIVAVISEDSDLLAYGCQVVIFKMDRFGNGEEIELDKVFCSDVKAADRLSFRRFTLNLFTGMCVLAGCDFLPSVSGIGIRRAHELVSKYLNLDRVISRIRFDPKLTLPEGYQFEFKQALAIFQHARVYDAKKRTLCFLTQLPITFLEEFSGDIDFLGPDLPNSIAMAIAEGRLDPTTMCAFDEQPSTLIQKTAMPNRGDDRPVLVQDSLAANTGIEGLLDIESPRSTDMLMPRSNTPYCTGNRQTPCVKSEQGTRSATSTLHYPSSKMEPDRTFIAQLQLIASNTLKKSHSWEEQKLRSDSCENSEDKQEILGSVSTFEKRGLKRVLPPLPTNNSFKRKTTRKENGHDINSIPNTFTKQPTINTKKDWPIPTIGLALHEDNSPKEASAVSDFSHPRISSQDELSVCFRTVGVVGTPRKSETKAKRHGFNFLKELLTNKYSDFQNMPIKASVPEKDKQVKSFAACSPLQSTNSASCLSSELFELGEGSSTATRLSDQPECQNNTEAKTSSLQRQWSFLTEHREDKGQVKEETKGSKVLETGILKFFRRTV